MGQGSSAYLHLISKGAITKKVRLLYPWTWIMVQPSSPQPSLRPAGLQRTDPEGRCF